MIPIHRPILQHEILAIELLRSFACPLYTGPDAERIERPAGERGRVGRKHVGAKRHEHGLFQRRTGVEIIKSSTAYTYLPT